MVRIRLLASLLALAVLLGAASARGGASTPVVVSQLFAAGGNTGAPYTNDFVELFNRSAAPVDLTGWTLQYASAASTSWQPTALSGTLPAGAYYLVQLASAAAVGAALPTPDATGTSNLAVSGGKVAIVSDATPLGCGASAGSCSADASVEDLVGYGSAGDFEGSGPAPALSATTALLRAGAGCTDVDDNASDFATASPNPRNSASAPGSCAVSPPSGVVQDASVDVDVQPLLSIALDHPSLSFTGAVPGTTPSPLPEHVTVTSNDASGYTLTVHRTAFAPADLPLGIGVTPPSGASGGGASGGGLAVVPIAPASDLVLGSTGAPSAGGGDVWATSVGFASPLPQVAEGRYSATLTFTVIGR